STPGTSACASAASAGAPAGDSSGGVSCQVSVEVSKTSEGEFGATGVNAGQLGCSGVSLVAGGAPDILGGRSSIAPHHPHIDPDFVLCGIAAEARLSPVCQDQCTVRLKLG